MTDQQSDNTTIAPNRMVANHCPYADTHGVVGGACVLGIWYVSVQAFAPHDTAPHFGTKHEANAYIEEHRRACAPDACAPYA